MERLSYRFWLAVGILLAIPIVINLMRSPEKTPEMDSSGFVNLSDVVPDAIIEARYFATYNFVGARVDGYLEPVVLYTREAAAALKEVSDDVKARGYRLKVYDAYRPQCAVDHFVRWGKDLADSLMNSRPDSALAVLEGAEGQMAGEHQRRQWQLLRMNAINKLDTVFTAAHVAHAQTLADYFDRYGTANEQMLAYYLLGRTYADAGEAPRAVQSYQDAISKADTTAINCDYLQLCAVYTQLSNVYHSSFASS